MTAGLAIPARDSVTRPVETIETTKESSHVRRTRGQGRHHHRRRQGSGPGRGSSPSASARAAPPSWCPTSTRPQPGRSPGTSPAPPHIPATSVTRSRSRASSMPRSPSTAPCTSWCPTLVSDRRCRCCTWTSPRGTRSSMSTSTASSSASATPPPDHRGRALLDRHPRIGHRHHRIPPDRALRGTLATLERLVAVTQRLAARYRHEPSRCAASRAGTQFPGHHPDDVDGLVPVLPGAGQDRAAPSRHDRQAPLRPQRRQIPASSPPRADPSRNPRHPAGLGLGWHRSITGKVERSA